MHAHKMQSKHLSAIELHKFGENLREEDKLEKALSYLDLALTKYTQQKDYKGKIDCLQSRFVTWKHLYLISKNKMFLINARKDVRGSLTLANKMRLKDYFSKCYFRMGELSMLEGDYKTAVKHYKKALIDYRGSLSEKGDYRYHLGEALYRLDKKEEGYKTMLQGLSEIEDGKNMVDSFLYRVWKTGCLMRISELLRKDNPIKAKKYVVKAENIINTDKRLVIRKRQLEELKKSF